MKVPPKRKGNERNSKPRRKERPLNESPSEKEGKCKGDLITVEKVSALNESPSEKEGKSLTVGNIAPVATYPQ